MIKIKDVCGDIEISFSTEDLEEVTFMSLKDKTLIFAPTYEGSISMSGKSILNNMLPTKIPVKMTARLPGYERKAET